MLPGVIVLRGLPGSSKSTLASKLQMWYRRKYGADIGIVENDDFFRDHDGLYSYDPSKIEMAVESCQSRASAHLHINRRCIVANTHTRHFEFAEYVRQAEVRNLPILIVHVQGDFTNDKGIPEERIEVMRERWEPFEGEIHLPVTESNCGLDIVIEAWEQAVEEWEAIDVEVS